MSEQGVIGKGTWIDKLAHELLEREKTLGRSTEMLRVESGLGASGVPHIGSLGDAVRAYGVKLALENFGYKSELIAYSDDLDGLRKIPEGFPDSLKEHLGKRVSSIPDPFDCHDSYGMHMSSLLLEGLDKLEIKYDFRRAKDTYEKGLLKDQIHTILLNSKKIGDKISELTGQKKFQEFLPYFPVCKNCDKLYTTESYEYVSEEKKIPVMFKGLDKILNLLRKTNSKATFFLVGELLESNPEIFDKILSEGHEIGFHTMKHTRLDSPNFKPHFREELKKFEKLTSRKSIGFRAPTFSLNEKSSWVINELINFGYKYDSSIIPAKTSMYGMPGAQKSPYRISNSSLDTDDNHGKLIEFPLLVTNFLGKSRKLFSPENH